MEYQSVRHNAEESNHSKVHRGIAAASALEEEARFRRVEDEHEKLSKIQLYADFLKNYGRLKDIRLIRHALTETFPNQFGDASKQPVNRISDDNVFGAYIDLVRYARRITRH